MGDERESHCAPTDVDVGMMVFALRVLADAPNGVDTLEEARELDGSAERPVGVLPAGKVGERGAHLGNRQHGHPATVYRRCVPNQVVVAGALISGATLLVAQRSRPPALAGLWELPGGKVTPGESDADALVRELDEELGVEVVVGDRLGVDVVLDGAMTLRAYLVTLTAGTVQPRDHGALRWVTADELDSLAWVPADRAWLPDLAGALRRGVR